MDGRAMAAILELSGELVSIFRFSL